MTTDTYETKNLKHEDFIKGFSFNSRLIMELRRIKNIKQESYWHEAGFSIDGTERIKRYHPLLNKVIINQTTGERGIIESVHKHWLSGTYWVLLYRKEGTQSHGTLWYKNINSINSIVIDAAKECKKKFKFEDSTITFDTY